MGRRPGSEDAPRQAPDTPASGPGLDRQAGKSGIALPVDLGRSSRLLDDAQLDRLTKGMTDEVRRRGRNPPDSPSVAGGSAKRTPAKAARAKPEEPDTAATVTPGQETVDPRRIRGRPQARGRSRKRSGSRGLPSSMLSPTRNATAARRSDRWSRDTGGRTGPGD